MKTSTDTRIAVLIDADNVPSSNIKVMMEEIAKYGTPTIKRIYGDWTRPNLSGWKNVLLENAIQPIQQYGYTTGKNATDSAMIQNVKVEWTQDTACTGYEPVACFYPSVATVQNLVTIGQAKAQIIQALLAKGYAVASDNILTK